MRRFARVSEVPRRGRGRPEGEPTKLIRVRCSVAEVVDKLSESTGISKVDIVTKLVDTALHGPRTEAKNGEE